MAAYDSATTAVQKKYEMDVAGYETSVKKAEAKYEQEMAEYNKKSFGQKLVEKTVLNENNKPVKQLPPIPYLQIIAKPILLTSYDAKVLAATYIHLEGYEQDPNNAVLVTVTLYGYDYSQPRMLSQQKDMVKYNSGSGSSSTYKATYYHTEYSYRHPMAIRVTAPNGKELFYVTPNETNIYKTYKSPESDNYNQSNAELLVKGSEEKILQENLAIVNSLLNNRFGYAYVKRTAPLSYIKKGGDEYADVTNAFNEASSGLLLLQQDSAAAKTRLTKALDLWNHALTESDPSNKKARIDKDVTIAICFNMLEIYFASADGNGGRTVLDKLNALDLSSGERKQKNDYELLFTDLANRAKAAYLNN